MQLRSGIRTLNAHEDILPKLYDLTHYTILENEEILEAQFMNTPGMRHTDRPLSPRERLPKSAPRIDPRDCLRDSL